MTTSLLVSSCVDTYLDYIVLSVTEGYDWKYPMLQLHSAAIMNFIDLISDIDSEFISNPLMFLNWNPQEV